MIGQDFGGMDYYGIGFSNIRLPNEEKSYIYKYKTGVNQFPEEVLNFYTHWKEMQKNMDMKDQNCMIMKNMDIKMKNYMVKKNGIKII